MNRKNLTAAVLASLTGVAGLAGGALADEPAVNLNPDGLGDVLVYPYYTTRDDNATLMTVVNTTDLVKAVKVRFLEAYNSREVLDFNLYLSPWDVWVAAVIDGAAYGKEGEPHLLIPDNSCTVPYLYGYGIEDGLEFGLQPFLNYAYAGKVNDGGPETIDRAAEGYMEIIEMGVLNDDSYDAPSKTYPDGYMGSASAATHVLDDDGMAVPGDCMLLERRWGDYDSPVLKDHPEDGTWFEEINGADDLTVDSDHALYGDVTEDDSYYDDGTVIARGGLFGGAAVINVPRGTMFSYDARALQGFDDSRAGIHYKPGTINPSLDDGNVDTAVVFLGEGQFATISYDNTIDAVSAVFMHDTIANTYVIDEEIAAATEWVLTFPTKSWYVDAALTENIYTYFQPDLDLDACSYLGWNATKPNPFQSTANGGTYDNDCAAGENDVSGGTGSGFDDWAPSCTKPTGYEDCTPESVTEEYARAPFTEAFDGESCDAVSIESWDRNESPTKSDPDYRPPIVSPAPPAPPGSKVTPFELCYEVNVVRFGDADRSVFGGTDADEEGGTVHVYEVDDLHGWASINFGGEDSRGLQGLPVTGFAAEQYTNGELAGGVLANYGGLFGHKGSVVCDYDVAGDCGSGTPVTD